MKIQLIGWQSVGLRCPDVQVTLGTHKDVPKVTLIQMPNGTGKTTTLSLIRAALTGEAEDWETQQVLQFRRRNDTGTDGRFLLRLSLDGKPLTFELLFDFVEGGVRYRTTSPASGGAVDGWKPPTAARRFLRDRFVSLFVFDGELANKMLKPTEARAEGAIDALCQLDLLDQVIDIADKSWQKLTRDRGARTAQGLASWKSREESLLEQITKVRKAKREATKELTEIKEQLEQITKTIGDQINADEKIQKALKALELREKDDQAALERTVKSTFELIQHPHRLHENFAQSLISLKEHFDRAKLPDATSRQFFVELAEEDKCVCGRDIGTKEREYILQQANQYLGNDVSGVINSLKQDVDVLVRVREQDEPTLVDTLSILRKKEEALQSTQTERKALEAEAIEAGGADLAALGSKKTELELRKQKLSDALEEVDRPASDADDEKTFCLASLNRQLEKVQSKIAEITDTVELRRKTDIIQRLVAKSKELAREHLKMVLVDQCNKQLDRILAADPVKIAGIQNSIILEGQREASVGQTLAVGYTFLTAALHRGAHEFPLIVDSPAGPLDDQVRKEIGEMVPKLCEQFVAFTISTEREGFLPAIERSAKGDIQYLTLFRQTIGTAHLMKSLPKTGVTKTKNAVLVTDRDYFVNFAVATETEE